MLPQRLLCFCALVACVVTASRLPSTTRSETCPVEIDQDRPSGGRRILVPNQANLSAVGRQQVQPRIINGDFASPNLLPYLVAIGRRSSFGEFSSLCTGTLVSANWVITAAHCEVALTDSVQIGLAQAEPTVVESAFRRIKKSVPHPDWQDLNPPNPTNKYDIAAFELASPAPDSAKFMKVNIGGGRPKAGEFARVMGYGNIIEVESGSNGEGYGRQVDVPISDDGICRRTYDFIEDDKQVCAGYQKGGCDSCQGDSGGPLIQYDGDEPVLIGVISFGGGCARPELPGVYVRTSAYKSFLDKNDVEYTSSGSAGLSAGAIAGIVIVCLLIATAVVVGAIYFMRKRRGGETVPTAPITPGAPPQAPAQAGYPGAPPSGGMPQGVPAVPVYPVTPTQTPIAIQVSTPPQVPSPPNVPAQMQAQPQVPLPPPPQVPVIVPAPPQVPVVVPPPPPSSGMN